MLKATKVRIYPTVEQAAFLNRQFGSVRFAYNSGLRIMSHRYKRHGESLSAKHDIKKLLPVAKKSRKYGWLKEADSMALQQACINPALFIRTLNERFMSSGGRYRPTFMSGGC